MKGSLAMAVKKNEATAAPEKAVKKENEAPVKAVKEEKAAPAKAVKEEKAAPAKKAEVKAEKKEEKKAAKPAEKKAPAKKPAPKKAEKAAEVYFEFAGRQVNTAEVMKAVEAACKANGVKSTAVKGVKVYVKAEDNAAYYVLENGESGKIDL